MMRKTRLQEVNITRIPIDMPALRYIIAIFFACSGSMLFAQQQDAVFTGAISIEKKLTRSWSATGYVQASLNENVSEFGYALYDAGAGYKITRRLSAELHYRYATIRSTENLLESRQYLYGDLQYVRSFGDVTCIARTRYMVKSYGPLFSEEDNYRDDKHFLRNRLQVKYDLGVHSDIFLAAEQIFRMDGNNETDQMRYSGGYNYTFNMHHRLQLQYTIARDANKREPDTDFISGVTYYYKF